MNIMTQCSTVHKGLAIFGACIGLKKFSINQYDRFAYHLQLYTMIKIVPNQHSCGVVTKENSELEGYEVPRDI